MNYSFGMLFMLFLIYSMIGWIIEVICIYYETGKLINRGFLIGPYCPIYGCGALFIMNLLSKYMDDHLIMFIMSIVICSILEYITSYIMEKAFNTRWWDYSNKKYNINGRICLETMIPFGILGYLMMYYINPFIINFLLRTNQILLKTIIIITFITFISDFMLSLKIVFNLKNISFGIHTDSTEKITKLVRKEIIKKKNYLQTRLMKAFPKMKIYKKK